MSNKPRKNAGKNDLVNRFLRLTKVLTVYQGERRRTRLQNILQDQGDVVLRDEGDPVPLEETDATTKSNRKPTSAPRHTQEKTVIFY